MKAIQTVEEHQKQMSGMALGGIGTGSVEIMPTGCLENWEIFNLGKWAATEPDKNGKNDLPDYEENVLPFYVRTKMEGRQPVVRKLAHDRKTGGFRNLMYSFLKNVETIRWTPDFPICHMEYEDAALPVEIKAEFMSAFVPHQTEISGTPGFYVNFEVSNPTADAVEVSLLGTLKNPVNRGLKNKKRKNTIQRLGDRTTLLMASNSDEEAEQNGSIALSVLGGSTSYIKGDYGSFFGAYVLGGEFGISEESCLFGFRDKGELPDLGWEKAEEEFLKLAEAEIADLDETETDRMLETAKCLASGRRPFERLQKVCPKIAETIEGKKEFLNILLRKYREFETGTEGEAFGDGALCSRMMLQPGESRKITFLLTWYFPYHRSLKNSLVGHRYNSRFHDAAEVAAYLADNMADILEKVRLFSDTLQNCSAPAAFVRNWVIQLSTLVKCSWWGENGDFGIWEGLGSCGFHTIDITYYGSFMILALFPELQLRQMKMGLPFQREDGRVHHFFTPDFEHVDEGYDRVDMNPQFVLMVCRDYQWTGDRDYLNMMWEPVKKAMDSIEALDSDGDGLPDQGTRANTYDAWRFRGTPSYICGLWLAALTAAGLLAEEMGDAKRVEHWQKLLKTGKENFHKLWNGSYFSLWMDGEDRDECLMSGQLDAAWYCKVMGIPGYVEDDLIRQALEQVWQHNYTQEGGMVNASYPEGKIPTLYTYENVQAESNWSGVEYALSSMYLEMGEVQRAEEIAGNVEERHRLAGRMFNHEECGEHYYRPLSAWTLMLSLAGFQYDRSKKLLSVHPKLDRLIVPWFTAQGYGILEKAEERLEIRCLEGELKLQKVRLHEGIGLKMLSLNGSPIEFTEFSAENGAEIVLHEETVLQPGESLIIE